MARQLTNSIFILIGIMISGCANASEEPRKSDVNKWHLGMSSGRLGRLDEGRLVEIKQAGFECIEIGLGRIHSEEDLTVMKAQAEQLQQLAQAVGIDIWSIHIPYGRDIDISQIDRTGRERAIEEVKAMMTLCEYLQPAKLVIHASFEPVPEEFIRTVGARVSTLHIAEYDGVDERHWLPGHVESVINWNEVIDGLVKSGYSGPFMFECAGTPAEKMAAWNKLKEDYLGF